MRADARKNYSHLLAVARDVVTEHGADASMREIARRANVGLATSSSFPDARSPVEALLCTKGDALTRRAAELETSSPPDEALVSWFREGVEFTHTYGGVCDLMASDHADPDSALHASSGASARCGRGCCSVLNRGNGDRRYGWGGPVRTDVGARLARRPTRNRAGGSIFFT